jgi:anti-sigma factor RsiW
MDPMSAHEMTCRELVEVVTEYVEGTLPADDRIRLEQHLEECPDCTRYIEQMRQTIEALGRLSEESLAPETQRDLLQAFRGWRTRQPAASGSRSSAADGARSARPLWRALSCRSVSPSLALAP